MLDFQNNLQMSILRALPDVSPGDASKAEEPRLGFCSQGAEERHHFAGR